MLDLKKGLPETCQKINYIYKLFTQTKQKKKETANNWKKYPNFNDLQASVVFLILLYKFLFCKTADL